MLQSMKTVSLSRFGRAILYGIALLVVQAINPALAADTEFYVHTYQPNSLLYRVDSNSGSSSLIGATGVAFLSDIAISPSGDLFGSTPSTFYSIDKNTAAPTLIGSLGTTQMVGLDFGPNGELYGVGQIGGQFFKINTVTGLATALFATPFSYTGDVAFYKGSTFFGAATSAQGSHLIEIEMSSGSTIDKGLIVSGEYMSGMDFDSAGRLIAFSANGFAYQISNPNVSGAGTLLSTNGISVGGATAPVPEPAVFQFALLAALPFALMVRRQRRPVSNVASK